MFRFGRACSASALILLLTSTIVWAQATAQMSGRVTDESGAVLPGVAITVTQTDTGLTRTSVTDGTGSYVLPNLPTGPYRLEVSLQGFRSYVQTGIVLQVGATPTINAVLAVGNLEETVSVEAATPLVDVQSAANFYTDFRPGSRFTDKKTELERDNMAMTLDLRDRMYFRSAVQQIVLQCMASIGLDALVYPTGNIPAPLLGAPTEPNKNGRSHLAWTLLGQQGFPAMTVPAGFTTRVYDRVRDAAAPGGTRLVGPVAAVLPVGVDFLGRPFDEATLFRIASAYEAATNHRVAPRAFGPLAVAASSR